MLAVTPASCPCCCGSCRDWSAPFPACASSCAATPASLCHCSMTSGLLRVLRNPIRTGHSRQLRVPAPRRAPTEKTEAPLSSHGTPAAQLLQLSSPRALLVAPAAHLLQGRAHRGGNQSTLPDHQCRGPSFPDLRFLQRPR